LPGLDAQQLDNITSNAARVEYQPGEVIYQQDDAADSFFVLIDGRVDTLRENTEGERTLIRQLEPGAYFGEVGLLEGGKRTMTVRASQDAPVVVLQLEKYKLEAILAASDMTRDELFHIMHQRVIERYLREAVPELTGEEIDTLMESIESAQYMPGDIIVNQGEQATRFFILASGQVALVDDQNKGIRTIATGETFGEQEMMAGSSYSHSVRADKKSRVLVISQKTISDLTDTYKISSEEIVSLLTQRYQATTMYIRLSDVRAAQEKLKKGGEGTGE